MIVMQEAIQKTLSNSIYVASETSLHKMPYSQESNELCLCMLILFRNTYMRSICTDTINVVHTKLINLNVKSKTLYSVQVYVSLSFCCITNDVALLLANSCVEAIDRYMSWRIHVLVCVIVYPIIIIILRPIPTAPPFFTSHTTHRTDAANASPMLRYRSACVQLSHTLPILAPENSPKQMCLFMLSYYYSQCVPVLFVCVWMCSN